MNTQELKKLYARLPQVAALGKQLVNDSERVVFLQGLVASAAPVLFAAVAGQCTRPLLFVMQDAEEAGYFYHDLCQMLGDRQVLFFPSSYRRAIKYAQRDAANEILRTEVLARLGEKSPLYVVTYPEAMAEKVVSKQKLDDRTLVLERSQRIEMGQVEQALCDLGFREVDYVYEPGQYARRGSIIDVYSYSCELPYRIDFFGDEIDTIRTFEVEDQLSKERRDCVEIVPELTWLADEKISFMSFLPADTVLVMKNYQYVRDCIERAYAEGFTAQARMEQMEGVTEMEQKDIDRQLRSESQLITGTQFADDSERFRRMELRSGEGTTLSFNTSPQPLFHKNFDLLAQALEDYQLKGYTLYILADSSKQQERLKEILNSRESATPTAPVKPTGPATTAKVVNTSPPSLVFTPVDKTLHEGFADNDLKVCLFTDHQIFDRFHKYNLKSDRARTGKVALTLKEIQQFEVGDYVVHIDHGVGKFGGLVRMPISATTPAQAGTSAQPEQYQEMIKIIYQRGDAIYVSIHSLYKVSKYKSQDSGEAPRLSTLGTGQWERLKERTKKQIKDIARDLINLYAARRRQKGFAFSPDGYMQHELEASFLYEDTPDQLKATQEVKADMEMDKPMDRLVCGDVGFGKTEVAVRAAFKAACDGKQVAVLVPTTVLAYQHFRTFSGRLKDMPVRVDYLTRARSTKQAKALLQDLAEGKIDILIGTHKLIGKSVKFKDLGLLIIDEEQKFGVSTKEKLRQLKTNVDTLTMSATPIPRTLQFSLVGARDMSVIQTPPPNRYPIQTEIHLFGAEIITEAINFELSRNGQVYFVNNRISDLTHIAEMIRKYVPDVRIAIGHGQMKPEELEQTVLDFSNHDYDVLLSTTIVENGIDIPNANTIIINSAHNFGLSDLHQMRGRVGRGNRKAFCYLLAPPLSALSPDSRRRLEALETFSDLGAGINIAMQDLDIRGAGNLLGAEQSGFISDLGYETYQKILNEAMAELKSEDDGELHAKSKGTAAGAPSAKGATLQKSSFFTPHSSLYVADCTIESDLEMYFPEVYVASSSERMLLYRELDNIRNEQELDAYRRRLKDRFGEPPPVAEALLQVVPLRRLGMQFGCEKIMLKQGRMFLYFVGNAKSSYYQSEVFGQILDFIGRNVRRCSLREQNGKRSMVVADVPSVGEAVRVLMSMWKNE